MSLTEVLGVAVGSTLLGLGAASMGAWSVRRRRSERTLLWFGLWCSLYGARLIGDQPSVNAAVGGSPLVWAYFGAIVTYVINIPVGLFLEALIGPGWRRTVRRVWQVLATYAAVAIAIELATGQPRLAIRMNSLLVLSSVLLALLNLWLYRDRLSPTFRAPAIAIGANVMLLVVLNENLQRPVAPEINLEPIGVLIFIVSLGTAVVRSVFRQEAELVAIQRELHTARAIQRGLLPRDVPAAPGLELAVRYVPMTAVAGDLYEFATLGPARIGVLVADVTGHGVPAALVASMVKLAFAAQSETEHDPSAVLDGMNRMLCRSLDGTFVTAVYAVFDTERRSVVVANAGHPPLLIGRADGTVVESCERGLMLGITPHAPYQNGLLDLRDGDRVLLYTDGIPETQSPKGEFLDLDRVRQWLAAAPDGGAAQFAESVLARLREWRGGETFEDDVTFVIARYGP